MTKKDFDEVIKHYCENEDPETARNYVESFAEQLKLDKGKEFEKIEKLTKEEKL